MLRACLFSNLGVMLLKAVRKMPNSLLRCHCRKAASSDNGIFQTNTASLPNKKTIQSLRINPPHPQPSPTSPLLRCSKLNIHYASSICKKEPWVFQGISRGIRHTAKARRGRRAGRKGNQDRVKASVLGCCIQTCEMQVKHPSTATPEAERKRVLSVLSPRPPSPPHFRVLLLLPPPFALKT